MYLLKKFFYIGSLFLSSLVSATSLSCISVNNQKCKVWTEIINVNSNEPVVYLFSLKQVNVVAVVISTNPYAQICVPDFVIDLNVFKLF